MHNIKKTPASEAHAINEERRRAEKMKMFLAARTRIFSKRNKGEYDEEILTLTAELLKKNPDIYSFWGIRRQALEFVSQKKEEEDDEKHLERLKKLYDDELDLTKEALFSNPKSYGAWYHRFLTFKNHPAANLTKELELCEKALSIDGRNFHCWDHRRSIAKLAGLTDADELLFSDKLIAQNPSNYSAWHYRATLLPRVQPDVEGETSTYRMPISEACLEAEFERTQNVVCMNSEDQTAWTYSRWLCEACCAWDDRDEPARLVDAKYEDNNVFILTFSKPVNRQKLGTVLTAPDVSTYRFEAITPFKCSEQAKRFECVESWKVFADTTSLSIKCGDEVEMVVTADNSYRDEDYFAKCRTFGRCSREKPRELLMKFAEVCDELIKIDKGDVPWEFIALAQTRLHLYGTTLENVKEVSRLFDKIKQLDPQRRAMYEELLSKIERSSIREASAEITPTTVA